MSAVRALVTVALLVLNAGLASAQETPGTVEVSADDGSVAVRLPADWRAEPRPSKTFPLSRVVTAPGVEREFRLSVYVLPRGRNARAQMWGERPVLRDREECSDENAVSSPEPLPHTVLTWSRRGETGCSIFAYVVRQRRCLTLVVEDLAVDAWPVLREQLLDVAQSVTTTLPQQPPDPDGYGQKIDRGIRYLAHPDVPAKDLAAVRKLVADLRKDFESRHGALAIDPANPPMVVVHAASGAARALCPKAAEAPAGQYFDTEAQCLYVVPPADLRSEALLVREVLGFLHIEAHGYEAFWLAEGECKAALAHTVTGKRLPALPTEMGPLPTKLPPFDKQLNGVRESLYWVLFFRYGPAQYRKAFDAYLDDLRETADADGALRRHLLVLDQAAMQAAADEFVAKKIELVDVR